MRKLTTFILVALAAAFLAVAGAVIAQAQPTTGETVFAIARPYLVELASVVVAGLMAWLVAIVRTKTGIEIEARHRDALQTALTNAAGAIIAKAGGAAKALDLQVGSPRLQVGVDYVIKATPDALAHFDLSPVAIAEKLQAKLGLLATPEGQAWTPPAPPDRLETINRGV